MKYVLFDLDGEMWGAYEATGIDIPNIVFVTDSIEALTRCIVNDFGYDPADIESCGGVIPFINGACSDTELFIAEVDCGG